MTPTNAKWEEEIRENCWDSPQGIMTKSRMLKKDGEFVGWVTETLTVDMVISKFSGLLLERERELMEKMEGMKTDDMSRNGKFGYVNPRFRAGVVEGYNEGLSKAQSLLRDGK